MNQISYKLSVSLIFLLLLLPKTSNSAIFVRNPALCERPFAVIHAERFSGELALGHRLNEPRERWRSMLHGAYAGASLPTLESVWLSATERSDAAYAWARTPPERNKRERGLKAFDAEASEHARQTLAVGVIAPLADVYKSLPRLCNDFGLRIIILKRENVAQHALALAVADAQAAARANSTKSVVLHFDDFQHVLDRVERQNAMLEYFANRAPPSCVLRLTFEELLSGSESSLLRVYQHINALDESQRPTAPPPSPPLPGNGSAEATEVPLRYAALPEPLLFDDVEKAPADFVVNWFAFRRRLSLVRHDLVFDLP